MLTQRSLEKELIDLGPDYYSIDEYIDCLKKLFSVSRIFGVFARTVKILKEYTTCSSIVDVGCGGGLFLWHLKQRFPHMQMMGIDINATAIAQAHKLTQKNNLIFKLQPHPELDADANSIDVILATYVCHHIADDALVEFIKRAYAACKHLIILNDLDRSGLSQFLFRLISPLLFRNRLINHDGLISIRRGFTRVEWQKLLTAADIKNYRIKWCFPFHWQIIIYK